MLYTVGKLIQCRFRIKVERRLTYPGTLIGLNKFDLENDTHTRTHARTHARACAPACPVPYIQLAISISSQKQVKN